jgi:hypothetical protein
MPVRAMRTWYLGQRGCSIGESANIVGVMWDFGMLHLPIYSKFSRPSALRVGDTLRTGDVLQHPGFFQGLSTFGTVR